MEDEIEPIQRRVVANIRRIAKRQGIPVTRLPDLAGMSRSHFWEVLGERASPSLAWLARIALALGVDPVELFRPERGPRA